jgi:hypothetical protein
MDRVLSLGTAAVSLCLVATMSIAASCYSSDPTDDQVLRRLDELGFEPDSVARSKDTIVVDDDIILDRAVLLAGEYGPPSEASGDSIHKGYRYKNALISGANAPNVKLTWATGARAPNAIIKEAFVAAATAWSSIPGSALRISTKNTGPAITVHMINSDLWPPTEALDCRISSACADFPKHGKPGANIYIENHPINLRCLSWKSALLAGVARHEIGHAIGLAHPKAADSIPVDNTKECAGTEKTCFQNPGEDYTTIMSKLLVGNCVALAPRITRDDYKTIAELY